MNKHLVLVGMMGSGKSTVGMWLFRELRPEAGYCDIDALIAQAERRTISDIFRDAGEDYFRGLESTILQGVLASARQPQVIATGGGLFMDAGNRKALLKEGIVFYLRASAEELAARTERAAHRPLLHGKDHLAELRTKLAEREATYRLAHHVVEAERRSVEEIGGEILAIWNNES